MQSKFQEEANTEINWIGIRTCFDSIEKVQCLKSKWHEKKSCTNNLIHWLLMATHSSAVCIYCSVTVVISTLIGTRFDGCFDKLDKIYTGSN